MKKLLGVVTGGVVLLAVAAALAVVGYRQGWFSRVGLKSQVASGGAGGGVAGQKRAAPRAVAPGAPGSRGPATISPG